MNATDIVSDATSYEVRKNVRLGFNGYWLQQVTDHKIDGSSVPDSLGRTVGLGPGLQLGGRDIWFHLNSYLEKDVPNRPSGIKVTFRVSKSAEQENEIGRQWAKKLCRI